jgi:2-polyprenyl-6-methoxyphenol hydroxylase-like FAD-dependent oxidoreductase
MDEGSPVADDGRQVLVVGDGVVGLCAAAFLGHRGLDPTVVPSAAREPVDCRVVLWPTAVSVLAELGVVGALCGPTTEVEAWLLAATDGTVRERLAAADDADPFRSVGRSDLRRTLRDRLPASSVRVTKTLRTLRTTDGPPVVEFDDGVVERFDLVVGADGTESTVKTAGFDAGEPVPKGTTTWTFRADGHAGTPGTVTELWGEDLRVLVGPDASGACGHLVTTVDDPAIAVDALRRALDAEDAVACDLTLPGPGDLLGTPDRTVPDDRWVTDRLALLGEAARSRSPLLTPGPSLGIEDAYVLAEAVADDWSLGRALGTYERRRRDRFDRLHARAETHRSVRRRPLGGEGVTDALESRLALLRRTFADRSSTPGDGRR